MTGQRPPRRSPDDPWRGARPTRSDQHADGGAEIEELAVRAVTRRGRGPIGASTVVALVALVSLLAAGFGVLGGRSQSLGPLAIGSPTVRGSESRSLESPPAPAETPQVPCGPLPPEGPPGVMLAVGDHLIAATVDYDENAAPALHADREAIDIPADAVAQLRIAAGACTTGWRVALWSPSDGQLYPVAILDNAEEDPAVAQANGLDIVLTPFRDLRGDELELRADFQLPGRNILARWPVRLLPFPRPQPALLLPNEAILPLVEGCDVVLTFNNGYEERRLPCEGDLGEQPASPLELPPGTPMSLDFDGWSIGDTIGFCGATSDRVFIVNPAPGCEQHPPHGQSFVAPRAGDWTFAVAACAVNAGNRICGTWYANIDTR